MFKQTRLMSGWLINNRSDVFVSLSHSELHDLHLCILMINWR